MLEDRYNPSSVESRLYAWWEQKGYFRAQDRSTKPPFSIILPPPNVTGHLHIGHALDQSIQDLLTRYKRMLGFNALWLPGTDHAGIATQSVVERELGKENVTRQQLGREKFVERVWAWKQQYGDRIVSQMKRLGASCDWDRLTFTLDEGVSRAVRRNFVRLYKRNQIYRGTKLINWSWPLETAISDLEVEHQEIKGTLYHIAYPITGSDEKLVVATTRPETLLGDTAVAVHPQDERYKHLVGKMVKLPLTDREIPIIADEYVEKEFGSGVVKITPAHDFNDYEMGLRHKLPMINILTKNGLLNENTGAYKGMKIQAARKKVLEDLTSQGLLVKEQPHTHSVGKCSRSGAVVEPMLSEQWFMRMKEVAIPAQRVVESGTTTFEPESWTKVYLHWMGIIQDWCISRQLWWGHRIPAWYCSDCGHITVAEADPTGCEKCQSINVKQDDDVLDTWFSSALWPFSTLGWPAETEALKTFYPTSVLVTGHDIIFFWVARMMMMGLENMKDVPFRQIYIHGLIRDAQGKKMSKSTGNSIDPVEMVDKYGADALRFSLISALVSGRDVKFSEDKIEQARNFMNKVWNATRFAMTYLQDFDASQTQLPHRNDLSVADQWIILRTGQVESRLEELMERMDFPAVAQELYSFIWNDFCDWYLEMAKPILQGASEGGLTVQASERRATQYVLVQTLNRIVRMLHPIAPFITEEIYSKLPFRAAESCMVDQYPTKAKDKEWIALADPKMAFEMELVKEAISALRNIRGENRISPALKINARLSPKDEVSQKILGANKTAIVRLARLETLEIGELGSLNKSALATVRLENSEVDIIVPLEGLVNIEEEVQRIQKTLEKMSKDLSVLNGKLANENYVKNAPQELVEADRRQVEAFQSQIRRQQEQLARLQG